MAAIGYARVSTAGQSLEAQEAELRAAGCAVIYSDVMTGKAASRPQWDACLKSLREGDTLVVTRLDRAGRSARHLFDTSDELSRRGVALKILAHNIDTSTSHGRLAFQMFSIFSEFEASLISERTSNALRARPRGRRGGRPRALSPEKVARAQELYDSKQMKGKELAGAVGCSPATLYRYITTDADRKRAEAQKAAAAEQ